MTTKTMTAPAAHETKTFGPKLKTALLAQAHVLQRAQEQRAQAEQTLASTFAERWTMRQVNMR